MDNQKVGKLPLYHWATPACPAARRMVRWLRRRRDCHRRGRGQLIACLIAGGACANCVWTP